LIDLSSEGSSKTGKSFTCTLYQDHLIILDIPDPKMGSKGNMISIYNLKTQKLERKDLDLGARPLYNHCACSDEEKNEIIVYGQILDQPGSNQETSGLLRVNFSQNSDGFDLLFENLRITK